jgi:hypothetical protein
MGYNPNTMMKNPPLLLGLFLNLVTFATFTASTFNPSLLNAANLNQTPSPLTVVIPATTSPALPANTSTSNQPLFNESLDETEDVTSTPTVTPPSQKKIPAPTHTLRPTSTPVPIPPPANPSATSLMILFGLIAVIVVVVGVWINRPNR